MEMIEAPCFSATPEWAMRILQDLPNHRMEVRWLVGPPHACRHEGEALLAVLDGCLDILSDETPHARMEPGAMALIAPGERHVARPHGFARVLTIAEAPTGGMIGSRWLELQDFHAKRLPACL